MSCGLVRSIEYSEGPPRGTAATHTRATFPGGLDGEADVLDVHDRQPEGATHRPTKGAPAERVCGAGRHDHTTRRAGLGGPGDCADIPLDPRTPISASTSSRLVKTSHSACGRCAAMATAPDGDRTGLRAASTTLEAATTLDAAGRQGVRQCRQFRVATTQLTARHDRDLERDTGLARVIDQSGAFEQDPLSVRSTGACDRPEPRDEWVLPTCDRLHRERTRRTRNARATRVVSVPASASRA